MNESDDYYQILGVSITATPQEIKNAYRTLALQYHPDRNKGDSLAAEQMKRINEAYAVLSDPAKRERYDTLRHSYGPNASDRFRQSYSEQDIFRGSDINQILEELARAFGFSGFDQVFRQMYGSGYRSFEFGQPWFYGKGIVYTAPFGGRPSRETARDIGTSGASLAGKLLGTAARFVLKKTWGIELPEEGQDWREVITLSPDQARHGGDISYFHRKKSRHLVVTIPPGVRDGQDIRLRGMGAEGKGGADAGDLYLKIHIKKPLIEKLKDAARVLSS